VAGIQIEQVSPPVGPSAPSAPGGTFGRIKGWWNRLPTWGKVVVVLIAIVLVILIWLFVGGVAGSSNGGSTTTSGNPGPSGGGGGTTPEGGSPTTTSPTTVYEGLEPAPTSTPTPTQTTTTPHGTVGSGTPPQHNEPTTSSQPAHAETTNLFANQQHATPAAYARKPASERVKHGTAPQNAAQVRPGLAPQIRAIRPMNAHAAHAVAKKYAPQVTHYTIYDRATPYHVKLSPPAKAPKRTPYHAPPQIRGDSRMLDRGNF